MNCCDDPKPRIGDSGPVAGRVFCGNCRRYLDSVPAPLSDDDSPEASDDEAEAEEDPS